MYLRTAFYAKKTTKIYQMHLIDFKKVKGLQKHDSFHINKRKQEITGYVSVIRFIDKDTKQVVVYAPSYDLSSYGKTDEKAIEMLKHALAELYEQFFEMSDAQLAQELRRLGWKKDPFRNKDFSRLTVDENGNLENFNAEEDTVKRFALVA